MGENTRTNRSASNDIEKRRVWIRISYSALWSFKDSLMMRRRFDSDKISILRCEISSHEC